MKTPKEKWWVLYALLPLAVVFLVVADLEAPTAGWRELTELAVSLGILGAMALWVRANRLALAMESCTAINTDESSEDTTGTPMRPRTLSTLHKRAA